jgi:hypothetical protein
MNPDIVRMAQREIDGPIMVGRVRAVVATRFNANSTSVWFSSDSLAKQIRHHREITLDVYNDLEWLLRHGEFVSDRRPNCFHIIQGDRQVGKENRWKACLKVVPRDKRIFLLSLHKIDPSSYRRLIRNSKK